ncbi:MAG: hypothetical protein FJ286_06710 [Planctomycetes bacterium]|nr:hypothetical protein [Planctomycetota bacterium]
MADAQVSPVPASVARLLASVRRQARAWVAVEGLSLLAITAVAAGWTIFLVDRLVEPPAWVRGATSGMTVAVLAWLAARRLVARLATPLSDEALSLAVERTHPEVGDALSTAVSCASTTRPAPVAVDPELVARTGGEAERAVGLVETRRLFRVRRLAAAALVAAAAVGLTAAAAASHRHLAAVWVRRIVLLSGDAWPRRVRLTAEDFPGGRRVVARGADLDVIVRVAATGRIPDVVELRSRGAAGWKTDRMGTRGGDVDGERTVGHLLAALTEDLDLEIRAGDGRLRNLRVVVAEPPAVERIAITCTPPAYLGAAPAALAASRVVAVPGGSRIDLVATATKPLAEVAAAARGVAADAAERGVAWAKSADRREVRLTIDPVEDDTQVLLRLTDDDGLVNRDPVAVIVDAIPDEPPRLALRLDGVSGSVTPAARLPVTGTISDDHGITGAAIRLRCGAAERELPIARAAAAGLHLLLPPDRPEVVALDALALSPGMRLAVAATARDGCGLATGPNASTGDTWTLDVVAPETLRALVDVREVTLRRRFEAAVADLAKARDDAAASANADVARPVAAAVARAVGETGEVARAFRDIRRELELNALLTPEIEARLIGEIAAPLEAVVDGALAAALRGCRLAADPAEIVRLVDAALAGMRSVIDRMRELESVNEVIERLRGVIDTQRAIHEDTLEQKRRRGREALESP